ncbi:MAG: hypothetical protein K0M45_02895 [Candidatus Paracaedibacteraceae bacterium]|nr:hypothetical protein [Candidatus Paracaedibacteraceae bacterium]
MKKLTLLLISFLFILLNNFAYTQDSEYIEIIQNGLRYNTTIEDSCAQYEESGYSFLDKTTMASNITFVSLNVILISGAAFTLGAAIHKYRQVLINYWANLNTSSKSMGLSEILPSTMPQSYLDHLQTIDDILSCNFYTESINNPKRWLKFPIYGAFKKEETSWRDCICRNSSKRKGREYLYGYLYRKGNYSVEIKCHFDIKKPSEVNTKNFYRINTFFKNYTKGIRRDPEFSPLQETYIKDGLNNGSDGGDNGADDLEKGLGGLDNGSDEVDNGYTNRIPPHPHLNIKNIFNSYLPDVKNFLDNFLNKENFHDPQLPLGLIKDNPYHNILKLLKKDESINYTLIGETYDSTYKKPTTHLYCLFPTYPKNASNEKGYNIVLHLTRRGEAYLICAGTLPEDKELNKTSRRK